MSSSKFREIVLYGKLDQLTLTESVYEKHDTKVEPGPTTITTSFEIGVEMPKRTGYVVQVTITMNGAGKVGNTKNYSARFSMRGHYSLDEPPSEDDEEINFVRSAVVRGSLQIYPVLRQHALEVLNVAGLTLGHFPFEVDPPDLSNIQEQEPTDVARPSKKSAATKRRIRVLKKRIQAKDKK